MRKSNASKKKLGRPFLFAKENHFRVKTPTSLDVVVLPVNAGTQRTKKCTASGGEKKEHPHIHTQIHTPYVNKKKKTVSI
jgi:hypothetical protein